MLDSCNMWNADDLLHSLRLFELQFDFHQRLTLAKSPIFFKMTVCTKNLGYLEIVSDSPGPLMLLLSLAQTGDSLLRPELEVGELGPRVGGQGLPEVSHLPSGGHVQFSSTTCCSFYVPAQLLGFVFSFSGLSQFVIT